ncbi:MAG TPA: outer membrane lipoprotein carrier protein LolA [bacterium (Candidatus Stahlbacteria)]|nr:outer membrane lipoprotein carrier protein LolA [Candidatus Stahlbacteria bacterium]
MGKVAYKAPDKMRIEIEGAEDRIDLIDGEYLWNYLPKEGKVYKTKIKKQFFDFENLIKDYRSRFKYKLIKSTPPYEIEFLPTTDDEAISKMVLVISKTFLIKKLTMTDPLGNESRFDFNRFTLNRNLPDKIFKLKLPEGVEVIEQ